MTTEDAVRRSTSVNITPRDCSSPSAQPVNWDPAWQHRPLQRATETRARGPLIAQPGHLSPRYDTEEGRSLSEKYWRETVTQSWDEVTAFGERFDTGLFPAVSGLVILDCDVKTYDSETGFVVHGNTATLARPVTRYGLNDLTREVEALGHSMKELATYAVRTKSGGVHLYYRENSRYELRTTGHRHDWRVDVIAHISGADRSWVAAPPTPGYQVIRDLPVAGLPGWLAEFLADVDHRLPPLGASRRRRLDQLTGVARGAMQVGSDADGLLSAWVRYELQHVALANQVGGSLSVSLW